MFSDYPLSDERNREGLHSAQRLLDQVWNDGARAAIHRNHYTRCGDLSAETLPNSLIFCIESHHCPIEISPAEGSKLHHFFCDICRIQYTLTDD